VKGFTRFVDSYLIEGRSSDLSPIRFKPRLYMNMEFLNIQHAKIHIYVRAVAGLDPNQEQKLRDPSPF